jgi:NitT/TauT family transport system substrate-binding protein
MAKLKFQRHSRIQEWVAEELGLFEKLGLDYEIAHSDVPISVDSPAPQSGKPPVVGVVQEASAYQDFLLKCAETNIASTSHWAVDTAVSAGHGKLWQKAYSVMPAGIYVRPGIKIESLGDLAGMEIVAGRHSGSHFSAVHALQAFIPANDIKLKFVAGRGQRLEYFLEQGGDVGSMYGQESYVLEQRGFQKVLDTSFMVNFMIVGTPAMGDVEKYFEALRQAQRAIDENQNKYKHYLLRDFPKKFRPLLNTERCGIGERLVFDSYPRDLFIRSRDWAVEWKILPRNWSGNAVPD